MASIPYSSPRVPPPRALSCLEPKAPARDLRGQRLDWQLMPFGAFLTWSLRPAPPRATPQRECPGDTRPRGQCIPYCGEGGSCFPCTGSTFTPRIDSHHGGKWNSLVGKPHGKDSRESHRCLDTREGKRDTAATAWEEWARACPHTRRGLTPLGKLQKYAMIHVSTREESRVSGTESTQGLWPRHRRERNRKRALSNSHGDWPFLRPSERVPEVPVISREHLPQLEKIQEVLPSRRGEAQFR